MVDFEDSQFWHVGQVDCYLFFLGYHKVAVAFSAVGLEQVESWSGGCESDFECTRFADLKSVDRTQLVANHFAKNGMGAFGESVQRARKSGLLGR